MDITEIDFIELKEIVLDHLQATKHKHTLNPVRLQQLTNQLDKDAIDLYRAIPVNRDDPFQQAIFASLNIPQDQDEYNALINNSDNLYHLLINLKNNDHHHVNQLIELIENTRRPFFAAPYYILGATLSAAITVFFYLNPIELDAAIDFFKLQIPKLFFWLVETFSTLRHIALIGLAYHCLALAWRLHDIFSHGTHHVEYKSLRIALETLSRGLVITAYMASYLAAGVMTPMAALLFMIGAVLDVASSFYEWVLTNKTLPTWDPRYPWRSEAMKLRCLDHNRRAINLFLIKFSTATLISASVILCCLLPPSALMSISCVIFSWLVSMAKHSAISYTNHQYERQLQQEISDIAHDKDDALTPSIKPIRPDIANNERIIRELSERVTRLENALQQHGIFPSAENAQRRLIGATHEQLTPNHPS